MSKFRKYCKIDYKSFEKEEEEKELGEVRVARSVGLWVGKSIFENLPEAVREEFNSVLLESHAMKVRLVSELHKKSPMSYEYNEKKSRVRSNYKDERVAAGRTRNNLASRRSRQRKKFEVQTAEFEVLCDEDENNQLVMTAERIERKAKSFEKKFLARGGSVEQLLALRKKCGLE